MKIDQTRKTFLFMIIFLAVGLLAIFVTHNEQSYSNQADQNNQLVFNQEYIETAKSWLVSAANDYSQNNIKRIRQYLLDFSSADRNIGQAHINLFLAFDAWDKYLSTQDTYYQNLAENHFDSVSELVPDLSADINNLQKVLTNA